MVGVECVQAGTCAFIEKKKKVAVYSSTSVERDQTRIPDSSRAPKAKSQDSDTLNQIQSSKPVWSSLHNISVKLIVSSHLFLRVNTLQV